MRPKVLVVDNFDSFTYILTDYLFQIGVECEVLKNNLTLSDYFKQSYQGVLLSPGPSRPKEAHQLMSIINQYAGCMPMLGICLGHQALGEYFGATLTKACKPMHGKISEIECLSQSKLFGGIPSKIKVVRYHSLILKDLPPILKPTAWTSDGELMAFEHQNLPIAGVQFHPEAALSEYGLQLLQNWVASLSK